MALLLRNMVRVGSMGSSRMVARRAAPLMATRVRYFGEERHPVEVHAKGAADGEIPETTEQSAGKAYEESLLEEEGRRRFNRGPVIGPFGTQEKPALILSAFDERIVGCAGGNGNDHDVNWFVLKKDQKTMCVLCGQFFMLVPEGAQALETDVEEY